MFQRRPRLPFAALIGFVTAICLVAAACGATGQAGSGNGGAAPDPDRVGVLLAGEFKTLSGGSIDMAELIGEDVVLWFWAPW